MAGSDSRKPDNAIETAWLGDTQPQNIPPGDALVAVHASG